MTKNLKYWNFLSHINFNKYQCSSRRARIEIYIVFAFMLMTSCHSTQVKSTAASDWDKYHSKVITVDINVKGQKRQYLVFHPDTTEIQKPTPVLIMYHGGGGSARHAINETNWLDTSSKYGFLAVFPEGIRPKPDRAASFANNPQTWNDGSRRYYAGESNTDDIAFTKALILDLKSRYSVDHRRVYATGFSNGASMAFRVGAELSDLIAAIAPVASSGLRISNTQLNRPVSMIYIHGTQDPRNPLEGGNVENRWVKNGVDRRPPISESILDWVKKCGCATDTKIIFHSDDVDGVSYSCSSKVDVYFYTVRGLGHIWPGGQTNLPSRLVGKPSNSLNANEIIWDFFNKHSIQ